MKKLIKNIALLVLLTSFPLLLAAEEKLKIAISKGSGSESYENYSKWLKLYGSDYEIEIVDLHVLDNPIDSLKECDGLLLSGGPDVHPGRFGKEDEADRCSIELERDTLEFNALKYAFEQKMPVLGICRGQQIINVELGGSLIIDIPEDVEKNLVHQLDSGDAIHLVKINPDSKLFELSQLEAGYVNSNHHQAVDRLANDLLSSAETEDGINEAFEWKDPEGKSWMMAVQWHPERLSYFHKLSEPIAKEFIKAVKNYINKNKVSK